MGRRTTSTELPDNRICTGVSVAPDLEPIKENLVGSKEGSGRVVRNRFDLEQEILECWKVTTDIKLFLEQGADVTVLSTYYDQKFERLWSTFESLCQNGKFK